MPEFDKHKHLAKIPKPNLLGFVIDKLSEFIEGDPAKFIKKSKKPDLISFILKNGTDNNIPDEKGFKKYKKPVDFIAKLFKSLPKITDEEQKALLDSKIALYRGNKRKFDIGLKMPNTEGKTDMEISDIKQKEMDKLITLEPHQKAFLNGFLLSGIHGAVAFHGVGTGKTFTAVSACNLYLKLYPDNKVLFVSPPALLTNFIESLIAYGIDPRDKRYQFYTYDGFFRSAITAENSLLIIDEAHNFRTQIPGLLREKDEEVFSSASSIKSYEMIQRGALTAHKALCLTGTVMVNKIYDIENLLSIADGKEPITPETFSKIARNEASRYDYFKYRVSMYFREIDYKTGKIAPPNPNFPEMREKFVPIVSKEKSILAKPDQKTNAVYTSSRQASMTDEKIDYCVNIIDKDTTKKFVIYTAFKDNVARVKQRLSAKNIKYGVISGDESTKEKQESVKGYNEYYNKGYAGEKHRVLIITKAGAEGIDLRETRGIFIIDGVWNEALSIQIIARAIRFRSHANLPEKDRYVDVYKLFVCTKVEEPFIKSLNSGAGKNFDFNKYIDKIKNDRLLEKQIASRKGRVYTGRSKIDDSLILKYSEKAQDFDNNLFESLRPKEKKEYIAKFGSFMEDREKYLVEELARITSESPSTDFYLFALQKSKEKIIIEFINAISRIPDVEQAFSDMALGQKAKAFIEKSSKTNATEEQISNVLIRMLKPDLAKVVDKIKTSSETLAKKIGDILEKGKQSDILKNRVNQEFFTPSHLVKELIELSQIAKDKRIMQGGFQVLDPGAGYGAIVSGLLKLMADKSFDLRVDMVEVLEENRKVLHELVKDLPTYLSLAEQPDFLKFVPNKAYDYVLMSPPFHLKKDGEYDYDFVQRAFAMLKPGGILVAITGLSYKNFPEAEKWYKDKGAFIRIKDVEWREFKEGEKPKSRSTDINYVKTAFIRLEKSALDDKVKNWDMAEDARLQEIAPKIDEPDNLKESIKQLTDVTDFQMNLVAELAKPFGEKLNKGKISKKGAMDDIIEDINKMEFKLDALYDNENKKLSQKETEEAEKQISLANFAEPKKRSQKPKVGDPDKPKRKKLTKKEAGIIKERIIELDKSIEDSDKGIKAYESLQAIRGRQRNIVEKIGKYQKEKADSILEKEKLAEDLKGAGFWSDFARGFKMGASGALKVASTILPFVL